MSPSKHKEKFAVISKSPRGKPDVLAEKLNDDGVFPNSRLPLLVFRHAVVLPGNDPASIFERLFAEHDWRGSWRDSVYPYHHYHSTSHEVLGVYCGSARLQLGGEKGVIHRLVAGDVVIIPAGVAHKNIEASDDFGVVGAYPDGRNWDMNYGRVGERPRADKNIANVPLPRMDPVYGTEGPLLWNWRIR